MSEEVKGRYACWEVGIRTTVQLLILYTDPERRATMQNIADGQRRVQYTHFIAEKMRRRSPLQKNWIR